MSLLEIESLFARTNEHICVILRTLNYQIKLLGYLTLLFLLRFNFLLNLIFLLNLTTAGDRACLTSLNHKSKKH